MAQDEWAEFEDAPPSLVRKKLSVKRPAAAGGKPTGEAYDGDTVRLDTGANARLLGYDAFERRQTARDASGAVVPIGEQSRSALLDYLPGASFAPNGTQSYGRPVGVLSQYGLDPATTLLRQGMGLAAPEYLANDPTRRTDYLEAERLARLNRLGVHGDSYVTPQAFRRGTTEAPPAERPKDGPWAQAEWSDKGGAAAVFADDPTPFQGLRQDIADGYIALTNDPNSTVDQIVDYGVANGFTVDRKEAEKFVRMRAAGHTPTGKITYKRAPRVLTDPGDGAFGATMRGVGDPLNFLDELGATVDSLGGTGGRENILNSDRRWADIYANNLDQNRSILANDDAAHPYARFGGQLVSGLAIPGASIEGVGLNAARATLKTGGTRMAAVAAAESAVRRRLAVAGAAEAGAAGAGAGEGGLVDRATNAAIYAPVGAALGYGTAGLAQRLTGLVGGRGGRAAAVTGSDAAPAVAREVDEVQAPAVPAAADAGSVPAVAATTIDSAALRAAADTGAGVDMGRAGDILRQSADDALARGDDVVLHVEGKPIRITAPGLVDDTGRRWGAMPILSPTKGDNARLEIVPNGRAAGASDAVPPVPAAAPAVSRAADDAGAWDEFEDAPADAVAAMANDTPRPTLDGPRVPDRIDLRQPRQLLADAPNGERIAAAQQMRSSDVSPLPANAVRDLDEAAGIEAGRYQTVRAPNEATTLERRNLPSPNDGTRTIPKRGPVDLVTWLRTQGGVREDGGELAYAGITNAPRNGMDFAGGEQRFGKLVANDGLPLDMAAQRAWEAGYFPDHAEPPTPAEFMDSLTATHRGWNRTFHPDDFAEVDAFEAARAQRLDVEAAQAEGAPLTLDRGQPVGPDDLDANAPPVRAYEEWGENAPDLAGNIRLDKLDSPQAIKRALVRTEQVTGGFDAAKRGRITQAETKALAEDLGMTADDLLQRRKGEAFNAEQALAARQLLARSASDLVNMAKRIARTNSPGDELEAAFREAWLRHAAIQEQVAGMTAEAGRLLQQFRMTADSRDATQALSSLGDIVGGTTRIKDVASRIVDLEQSGTTPAGINQFALKALSNKWKDRAVEFYINSLLSGPQTHAVNILSNTLTSMAQIPEHLAAAVVGAVRRSIPSQRETERVLFSEAGSRAVGMVTGAREGIRAAARSFLTGESSDAITKIETQQMAAIPGPLGSVIRTPTRLLTAEDEFFKAVARRMELGGLAIRQAKREGLKGQAAKDRAADLMLNPTEPMLARMFDYARYVTFQTPLEHGSMAAGLSQASQGRPQLKLLFPFVRTPVNLLKFAAERSPAAPLMKSWRKEIVAGGARRDLAIARMLVGTGFGAAMYEMAADGHITGGGPADDKARRLMLANGWQPYSFKIGDRYYSYSRLDPFATTIGTVADMVDIGSHMTDKQREQSATLIGVSIMSNLSNKTWLSGISSALEAMSDPSRYLQGFLSRTAGAIAVPSIVAQLARTTDPVLREARAPLDRIRSRIPSMSDDLFPRRDVFGKPVAAQEAIGPDLVSPLFAGTDRNDRTIEALLSANINVTAPQRTYRAGGKRVEWTPEQYDRLQVFAGQIAKPQLDALTGSAVWKQLTEDQRDDEVAKIMKDARADAKAAVLSGAKPDEASGQGAPAGADPWAEFQDAR
ncbi:MULTISPECIES: hypothetical protein [unclassified Sphingomonas]|uniref:hypothetical protein n=1 Tax=unclassified Sphingomonas TaxID=196159 RepID=UPI0006F2C7FF|nr:MULTISPECIES: hypothetical protein [unclassified Sphingomonas]KQM64698.1 hypothetical protein ASE65_15625 [Sphingomonas sp. Leaf16]KQN16830.1 hypothetical protein ASE81_15675 [Sphingomonas sp. Leaf29]KQN22813.1 hypothetical protein ASE83_15605 [Sphingomonas sp. Leaf32]